LTVTCSAYKLPGALRRLRKETPGGVRLAIRDIVKHGDPRLLAPNAEVSDFHDPAFAALIQDLKETCWAAPGLGLAAPQIGANLRVAVVDLSIGKDPSKLIVLENPVVVSSSGLVREEEGCLSLPELVEVVDRPESVTVEAFDGAGEKRSWSGTDLLARAFCHEIDHLNRRLYVDRLSSLKRSLLMRKVAKRKKDGSW
jgi:peptide deformylase